MKSPVRSHRTYGQYLNYPKSTHVFGLGRYQNTEPTGKFSFYYSPVLKGEKEPPEVSLLR